MNKDERAFPVFWKDNYNTSLQGGLTKQEFVATMLLANCTESVDDAIELADELLDKCQSSTPIKN